MYATVRWLIVLGAVLCVGTVLAVPPRAAEFDVYRLTHVSPDDARRMLHEMAGSRAAELQIVVDAENAGLMIRGPHELRRWAAQILVQIDHPAPLPTTPSDWELHPAEAAVHPGEGAARLREGEAPGEGEAPAEPPQRTIPRPAAQPPGHVDPPSMAQILRAADCAPTLAADVVRAYPVAAAQHAAVMAELYRLFRNQVRLAADTDDGRLIIAAKPAVHERIAYHVSHISPPSPALPPAIVNRGRASQTLVPGAHPPSPPIRHSMREDANRGRGVGGEGAGRPFLNAPLTPARVQWSSPATARVPRGQSIAEERETDFHQLSRHTFANTPVNMVDHPFPTRQEEPRDRLVAPAGRLTLTYTYSFQHRGIGEILQALQSFLPDRLRPTGAGAFVLLTEGHDEIAIHFDDAAGRCVFAGPDPLLRQFSGLLLRLDSPQPEPGRLIRFIAVGNVEPHRLEEAVNAWRGWSIPASGDGNDPGRKLSASWQGAARWAGEAPWEGEAPAEPAWGDPRSLDGTAWRESRTPDSPARREPRPPDWGGMLHSSTPAGNARAQTATRHQSAVRLAAYQALGINGPPADPPVEQRPQQQPPQQQPAQQQPPPGQPPATEPLRHPSSDIEIQSLPDLDVIILRGRSADVEELTRIINELERISAETTPQIEVYPLQHVRGESLNQLIAQVLEDLTGTLQGRVSITPLLKPNALLLIGWGEAVEAAKRLIAELDQPVPADTQVRVFPLVHAPAAQMQTTIEQFYADRTGLAPQFEITADPRTNSLIINASPRDMHELELLIRQLDVAKAQAVNQGRVIRLQNSLAADIAQTLQDAIEAARGGGTGPDAPRSAALDLLLVDPQGRQVVSSGLLNDVRITADPRTNTLIITGPAESMDLIEALVAELDASPATAAQIKVFQIVNGDATEMVLMLRSLFPADPGTTTVPQLPAAEGETSLVPVRFSVDTRTNSIIATGSASDLRIIEALLARLDAEEAQQRINRVYRLRNSPALDVAAAVNEFLRSERIVQRAAPGRPNPFQQIESEVVVVAEPVGNSLIISASPRFFEEILALVESLDEQPPQVLVQVIIAEVDLDNLHEFGVELGLQDSVLFDRSLLGDLVTTTMSSAISTSEGVVTTTNEVIQAASLTPGFDFNNLPLGNSGSDKSLSTSGTVGGQGLSHFNLGRVNSDLQYGGLVLSASSENVNILLRALDQRSHVEILSRPQIMTLDNQPAFIQVGQRVPRIVASSISTIGQINTVELEDVGLILGLTPRISPEGMVVMDIDAEKSQVGPEREGIPISVSAEGEIVRSPRVDITRAQTTVSAGSGQTIVLGGLITNDNMSLSRRVPWLSDIPLLGALFKYDSDRHRRKELLIIMTPHVIRGPEDAEYYKQLEMARMTWCTADFFDLAGPSGAPPMTPGAFDDAGVPIIYPDLTPGMEWREEGPAMPPQNSIPAPPKPTPIPDGEGRQ